MRRAKRSRKSAFTLVEMMLTLALVALMGAMIATILVQIARYVRVGREIAEQRYAFLTEIEVLRYQLRSLHYPSSAVGLLGLRGNVEGRDSVRFITSRGHKLRGMVEVGYKIESYIDPKAPSSGERFGLFYREFPFRRLDLRSLDESTEGKWRLVLPNTSTFTLEYSTTGQVWQREWEAANSPRLVRVRVTRSAPSADSFTFDVTPGEGAARW